MCVTRTALSVVLTLWPPGPPERKTSMRKSLSSILTSTSSASGKTATVAAEVWMRPCCSVTRSEEHTSELQSQSNLVCRLLLEKKKKKLRSRDCSDVTAIDDLVICCTVCE